MTRPGLPIAARCRVAVDNDWAGDPAGLIGLAHHLLSPGNRVTAVTSSFHSPVFAGEGPSAVAGAELARELIELLGVPAPGEVHAGSEGPFDGTPTPTPAAEVLIAEARRDDPLPLYLVCAGPLTNVAQALLEAPDIASRLTLLWVGGSVDPTSFEYARDTDARASEFVFRVPGLDIWQFPVETYRQCAYSFAELEEDVGGSGPVGRWLWQRFLAFEVPEFVQWNEGWALGACAPLLVTALRDDSSRFTTAPLGSAPGGRCTYTAVDARLVIGDLLAKLRRHARDRAGGA